MGEMDATLEQLRRVIEREGPPLTDGLTGSDAPAVFGPLVACGERVSTRGAEYALLIESVFEGYLLHYSSGRVLDPSDADVRLLAGDFLYAYGLTCLAGIADTHATADLADLIALCAAAHAGENGVPAFELSCALWILTSISIASGRWKGYEQAKRLARMGDPDALGGVEETALERATSIGLKLETERALIAFRSVVFGGLRQT